MVADRVAVLDPNKQLQTLVPEMPSSRHTTESFAQHIACTMQNDLLNSPSCSLDSRQTYRHAR